MAHNLATKTDGSAMLYYAGEVPWHGLGTGVESARTSKEALKLAGMDWQVVTGPVFGGIDIEHAVEVEGARAIIREDTGHVFGIHSEAYVPWQNSDAVDFTDSLLKDGRLTYESVGALGDGRRCWALARMENGMKIGDDKYQNYFLLTWGHYRAAIIGKPTSVRVICNNTLDMAMAQTASREFKIAHRAGMFDKLEAARELMSISTESQRRLKEFMEQQIKTKVTDRKVDAVIAELFPAPAGKDDADVSTRRQNAIDTFRAIYDAETQVSGKTAYTIINAATGYADHALRYNGDTAKRSETRFMSTLVDGKAHDFKAAAIQAVLAVTH